jgi:hypothetical protein
MKKEQIGYITVDSGTIQVGDPCYNVVYDEIVEDLIKTTPLKVPHKPGVEGKSIIVSTAFGDGIYPVYIKYDKYGIPYQLIVGL